MLALSFMRQKNALVMSSIRMFNTGGKWHNAPSSNIKETNFKFPKHTELFADDYYDDLHA